jgi:hypothetical protein
VAIRKSRKQHLISAILNFLFYPNLSKVSFLNKNKNKNWNLPWQVPLV